MRSTFEVNRAFLAKVAWRILSQPQSFLANFFLSKYCRRQSFLEVKAKSSAPWSWTSIFLGRDLLKPGIGDGSSIYIHENWIPNMQICLGIQTVLKSLNFKVRDLIDSSRRWRVQHCLRKKQSTKFEVFTSLSQIKVILCIGFIRKMVNIMSNQVTIKRFILLLWIKPHFTFIQEEGLKFHVASEIFLAVVVVVENSS